MNILLTILLLVFGVLLLIAELFLLPGFGIAGVCGFLSLAGAVVVAYIFLTPIYPWAGHVTLAACVILTAVAIYAFIKGRAIEKIALNTTIDSKVDLASPGKKIENLEKAAQQLDEQNNMPATTPPNADNSKEQ